MIYETALMKLLYESKSSIIKKWVNYVNLNFKKI